eukprot:2887896-Rhodomonas_salina.3
MSRFSKSLNVAVPGFGLRTKSSYGSSTGTRVSVWHQQGDVWTHSPCSPKQEALKRKRAETLTIQLALPTCRHRACATHLPRASAQL